MEGNLTSVTYECLGVWFMPTFLIVKEGSWTRKRRNYVSLVTVVRQKDTVCLIKPSGRLLFEGTRSSIRMTFTGYNDEMTTTTMNSSNKSTGDVKEEAAE